MAGHYGHPWIEFRVGNCSLMVFRLGDKAPAAHDEAPPVRGAPAQAPRAHEVWVFVDDLDTHLARAQAAGAKIVSPIRQTGFLAYTAEDLEGNRWVFAQARPRQL